MKIPHYKFGCLICGKRRRMEHVADKSFDVYLVSDKGNRFRIGLCEPCFTASQFDMAAMKESFLNSEIERLKAVSGKETSDVIEEIRNTTFVSAEGFKEHWERKGK